ncbi:hypothetical protein Pla175_34720 [Pirellulimonas nuda]|uniref:Uncharacterized protein n=1 Tax=Pirellulimonas nuda TaxID=2528009 RepID=A0A518DF59_9BACT|nr:hypothetical protein [Pirellulimonas nuda]QDU90072.1 hypothetical protein Pla175_34720 [Pirellulimonas nuda]
MTESNPYAAPLVEGGPHDAAFDGLSEPERKRLEIGRVVVAWEKRRWVYNAVLGVATLPLLVISALAGEVADAVRLSVIGACVANASYLAGPIAEGYWTWFVGPATWLRTLLFLSGTLLALLLVAAVTLIFCMRVDLIPTPK